MLGNEFTMVGGWKWFNKSDTFQLKTPTIYQGSRKKGSPLDKSRTLHENPPEYQPSGEWGARLPPKKSKMAARGPQNGGRGLALGFWAF